MRQGVVVALVRIGPGGVLLGLLGGLPQVGEGPLLVDRPGPHERLVQQVFDVVVGPSALHPAPDGLTPALRDLREQIDPGTHVCTALGVVGGQGEHRRGPVPGRLGIEPVELLDPDTESLRRPAHLVERHQPVVAVEGRVLDPLGHDGGGDLLEPHHQLGLELASQVERHQAVEEVEELRVEVGTVPPACLRRPPHDGPVLGVDPSRVGIDVGAVDGQAGHELAQRLVQLVAGEVAVAAVQLADLHEQLGQPVDVAG